MRPSSSSATHAELLLCRRHTPASSATHAELHRHRRHTPDVGTRHRLRLRRHTPTSSAPATHAVEHITPGRIDTRSIAAASPLATMHMPTHGPATSPCRRQRALCRCTEPLLPSRCQPTPARLRRGECLPRRTSPDTNCWNRGSTDDHKNTRYGDERHGRRTACMLASLIPLGSTQMNETTSRFIAAAPSNCHFGTRTHALAPEDPARTYVSHSSCARSGLSPSSTEGTSATHSCS